MCLHDAEKPQISGDDKLKQLPVIVMGFRIQGLSFEI